jgi:hypothetical protein
VLFEGSLNRFEVSFLIQYAVNALMTQGAIFNITPDKEEDDEDAEPMRITLPKGDNTLQ